MNKYIIESFEEYVNGLKINEDTSQDDRINNFFNDKYVMDTIVTTSLDMYIKLNDLDVNYIDKIRNSNGFNEFLKKRLKEIESDMKNPHLMSMACDIRRF